MSVITCIDVMSGKSSDHFAAAILSAFNLRGISGVDGFGLGARRSLGLMRLPSSSLISVGFGFLPAITNLTEKTCSISSTRERG